MDLQKDVWISFLVKIAAKEINVMGQGRWKGHMEVMAIYGGGKWFKSV